MSSETDALGELAKLPRRHRLAFAACCCERMFANYEAFYLMEEWGDPAPLRHGLDAVWKFLRSETVRDSDIGDMIDEIMKVVPDSNRFTSMFVAAAQDAAAAIIYTLQCAMGTTSTILKW